jgi:diguanylate cyclase (GGDEF)-like protein/PAS domain S-box-containing protein
MPLIESSDLMYRQLIQSVVDYAIYMLTPEGIVANWNPGAERAKGYKAHEIVGQHFSAFYSQQDRDDGLPEKGLNIARTTGQFETQGWRLRKDGTSFWAHVVIDAIRDEAGKLIGFAKITRDCTEQQMALLAQREQERRFRLLVQGVTDYAIYMLDPQGHVVNWNAGAQRAKGYKAEEIIGQHFSVFYTPNDRAQGLPQQGLATALREGRFEAEGIRLRKDGTPFWTHVVIDAIYHDEDGQLIGFAKITRDISERRRQELELIQAKELAEQYSREMASLSGFLDSVISNIPASVIVQDTETKKILLANQQAEYLFGGRQPSMVGRKLQEGLQPDVADYMTHQITRGLRSHGVQVAETQVMTGVGERTLRSRTLLCKNIEGQPGYVLFVAEDVTEELAAHAQIHHMAHHDSLTGLPNRTLFNERLTQALERDHEQGNMTGVLCLDLDNFKNINDALGHAFGDKLLLALGKRLRRELREEDTLARLGGDEFAIVLSAVENLDAARITAQRLINAITKPFSIDGHGLSVGVSIGISVAPDDHHCAQQLLGYADMALYEAKRNGRNRQECFRYELDEAARTRRVIETDLRTALQLGQLQLHYQPIIDTQDGSISGYEALMRWEHPVKGMIMPLDFISIAEETGLIHEVGSLALDLACREAASWGTEQTVAVNLSPTQFKKAGLVEMVAKVLIESGLAPRRLELEITESVLLDNTDDNIRTLRDLKALGVGISLDDFGTGYSSLGYLRSFPFDRIKIDKSFIRDMGKSQEALSIIRAITGMSNSLSIKTTAEGVETREQQLQLEAEGCSHFQGFLFGHPVSAPERLKEAVAEEPAQCMISTGADGSPLP